MAQLCGRGTVRAIRIETRRYTVRAADGDGRRAAREEIMRVRFALALAAAMTAAGVVTPRAYGANLLPGAASPTNLRSAASASTSTSVVRAAYVDAGAPISVLPDDIDFIDLNLESADFPPLGYVFEGTFFHRDACEAAGTSGIPRAWPGYVCLGGDVPWDFSDLYVRDFN
jgi:hypothetical protein